MVSFHDGPAAGVTLTLRRTPRLLRVVCNDAGDWDALDQLSDTPEPDERISVYLLDLSTVTKYHLYRRHGSGWYYSGEYRLFDPQPADDVMRDTERWREWATAHLPADPLAGP